MPDTYSWDLSFIFTLHYITLKANLIELLAENKYHHKIDLLYHNKNLSFSQKETFKITKFYILLHIFSKISTI